MSSETGGDTGTEGPDRPLVPEAVLDAIERLEDGETATRDEIEDALKF